MSRPRRDLYSHQSPRWRRPRTQTAVEVDPPDTVYQSGALPEDPVVERKRAIVARHRAFLPVSVDLTSRMPPVGDQGKAPSCTAWATAYAARSYYTNTLENRDLRQPANVPSPNYVFYLSRQAACDQGSQIGLAVEVLKKGALSLAEYPYSDKCQAPASRDFVERASDFKVRGLIRVDTDHPDDIKGQLAKLNPVMISFKLSSAWMKLRGAQVFTEREMPPDDKNQGGHAMTIVGYDDRLQAFRVMNSWSTRWGDRGFGWMSYDVLPTRLKGAWVLDVAGPAPGPTPTPTPTPDTNADHPASACRPQEAVLRPRRRRAARQSISLVRLRGERRRSQPRQVDRREYSGRVRRQRGSCALAAVRGAADVGEAAADDGPADDRHRSDRGAAQRRPVAHPGRFARAPRMPRRTSHTA